MINALLALLAVGTLAYFFVLIRAIRRQRAIPKLETMVLGAVVNFFDTLGIGSFATTMSWLKFRRLVPDRLMPQTMLVGLTPPSMLQAVIFIILLGVSVDPVLLVGCVLAVLLGGIVGVRLVTKARTSTVQLICGLALLAAAFFYSLSNLNLMPAGGTASGLSPAMSAIAIAANFMFGILINFGVGNYAPTLALLSLMGMNPRFCFPIMAGGAALAASAAASRHIVVGEIDLRIAVGIAVGGIPAVLLAAFVVKSMPIDPLRWLVTLVVLYAAFTLLRSAHQERAALLGSGSTKPRVPHA